MLQHLAFLFGVGVGALMELDHAAQFLFAFLVAEAGGDAHTEQAQNTAHHMRGDPVDRPQHPDQARTAGATAKAARSARLMA